MKKSIAAIIILMVLILTPQKVNAKEMRLVFGVVLNSYGDGLLLDPETGFPAHWYYNYISYEQYAGNIQVGEYIYTLEFLDEYGEVDSRIDYHSERPLATEEQLKHYRAVAGLQGIE